MTVLMEDEATSVFVISQAENDSNLMQNGTFCLYGKIWLLNKSEARFAIKPLY